MILLSNIIILYIKYHIPIYTYNIDLWRDQSSQFDLSYSAITCINIARTVRRLTVDYEFRKFDIKIRNRLFMTKVIIQLLINSLIFIRSTS